MIGDVIGNFGISTDCRMCVRKSRIETSTCQSARYSNIYFVDQVFLRFSNLEPNVQDVNRKQHNNEQ